MVNHVVILGSINVDTILQIERLPLPGETLTVHDKSSAPGGKGANQAVAAARSGARTGFIGNVGDDDQGRMMLKHLRADHIDTSHIKTDQQAATGAASILLDMNGQNSVLVYGGANQTISVDDIYESDLLIRDADMLVTQFETPVGAALKAFEIAKKYRVTTILNPAPAQDVPHELLQLTDLIVPNETESRSLTGIAITDRQSMTATAEWFRERGISNLIITLGDRGAYYSTPVDSGLQTAFQAKAVDTTAAGDTFIGALASRLDKSLSNLPEAVKFAQRASSLTVQKMGAQPSIPYLEDIRIAQQSSETDRK